MFAIITVFLVGAEPQVLIYDAPNCIENRQYMTKTIINESLNHIKDVHIECRKGPL